MTRKPQIDRQREHQANERTFLAWLRTSIALITFGFAIAKFSLFLKQLQTSVTEQEIKTYSNSLLNSENLGVSLVIVGIVVIGLSAWRYNLTFRQIESGNYRPNRLMVWLLAGVVMLLGTLSIPLVIIRDVLGNSHSNHRTLPKSPPTSNKQ